MCYGQIRANFKNSNWNGPRKSFFSARGATEIFTSFQKGLWKIFGQSQISSAPCSRYFMTGPWANVNPIKFLSCKQTPGRAHFATLCYVGFYVKQGVWNDSFFHCVMLSDDGGHWFKERALSSTDLPNFFWHQCSSLLWSVLSTWLWCYLIRMSFEIWELYCSSANRWSKFKGNYGRYFHWFVSNHMCCI